MHLSFCVLAKHISISPAPTGAAPETITRTDESRSDVILLLTPMYIISGGTKYIIVH